MKPIKKTLDKNQRIAAIMFLAMKDPTQFKGATPAALAGHIADMREQDKADQLLIFEIRSRMAQRSQEQQALASIISRELAEDELIGELHDANDEITKAMSDRARRKAEANAQVPAE